MSAPKDPSARRPSPCLVPVCLVALFLGAGPASGSQGPQALGQDAVQPSIVKDAKGNSHMLPADGISTATVLLFVQPDCPISNQYAPVVHKLRETFETQGVRFFRVYADADVTPAAIAKHTREYQYRMPALRDPDRFWTRLTGATITPEAVVFDRRGGRVYRGRLDNRYVDFGKKRRQATSHDLQWALEAVLAGKKPDPAETVAVGCYIP